MSTSCPTETKLSYTTGIVFILSVLIFLIVLCNCITSYNKHGDMLKAYQAHPNGMAAYADLEKTKLLKEILNDPSRHDHILDLVRHIDDANLASLVELQKVELLRTQMLYDRTMKQINGMPAPKTVEEMDSQIEQIKSKLSSTK